MLNSLCIGTDILEMDKMEHNLENVKFLNKVLSIEELEVFNSFHSKKRKLEYLSGRFCAKEAIFKMYKKFEVPFNMISVLNDEYGSPYVVGMDHIKLSISHTDKFCMATAIMIDKK